MKKKGGKLILSFIVLSVILILFFNSTKFTGKVVENMPDIEGLVGYWNFDGDAKDYSGQGNDGIAIGMSYQEGKLGKAGYFNGSSYVYGKNKLVEGNEITQCAWIQQSEANAFPTIFNLFNNQSAKVELSTSIQSGSIVKSTTKTPESNKRASAILSIKPNNWYFVCGVFSKNNYRAIYIDGKKLRENTDSINFSYELNSWSIGSILNLKYEISSNTYAFKGLIDEVRVYNRMLNGEEINKLYLLGKDNETNVNQGSTENVNQSNENNNSTTENTNNQNSSSTNESNNNQTNSSQNTTPTQENNVSNNLSQANQNYLSLNFSSGKILNESGLVGYYPFENNFYDYSGKGNNLTYNGYNFATGKVNNSALFDGKFILNKNFNETIQSVCFWIYLNSSQNQKTEIFSLDGGKSSIDNYYGNIFLYLNAFGNKSYNNQLSYQNIPKNEWHHLCILLDDTIPPTKAFSYVSISVILDGNDSKTLQTGKGHLSIFNNLSTSNFNGNLDELRLYNYKLSNQEVEFLYKNNYLNSSIKNSNLNSVFSKDYSCIGHNSSDYYSYNIINLKSSEKSFFMEDYCDTSNYLNEYFCENGLLKTESYLCPNGCLNGKCLNGEENECSDSDGGENFYEKGNVKFNGQVFSDTCYSSNVLFEMKCSNKKLNVKGYSCPYGCSEGKCKNKASERTTTAVLYYPFDDNLNDYSKNNYSFNGDNLTYRDGKFGGAWVVSLDTKTMVYNGTIMKFPNAESTAISVCYWSRGVHNIEDKRTILFKLASNDSTFFYGVDQLFIRGEVDIGGSSIKYNNKTDADSLLQDFKTWHHYCSVFSKNYLLETYMDGERTNKYNFKPLPGVRRHDRKSELLNMSEVTYFEIGNNLTTTTFESMIDELRVYGSALSGEYISKLYNTQINASCTDSDLNKINTFGTTCSEMGCNNDYCSSEEILIEFGCSDRNSKKISKEYQCPNGCKNGECLSKKDYSVNSKKDLILSYSSSGLNFLSYLNNFIEKNNYLSEVNIPLKNFEIVDTADADGDGLDDILWKNDTNFGVWFIEKDGNYREEKILGNIFSVKSIALSDFDENDFSNSILIHKENLSILSINNKALSKIDIQNISFYGNFEIVDTADADGDGLDDILWKNDTNFGVWFIENDSKNLIFNISSGIPLKLGNFNGYSNLLSKDLVAYYPFDGDSKDYSGNENDLDSKCLANSCGSINYKEGYKNLSAYFTSSSSYGYINKSLFNNYPITQCAWINPSKEKIFENAAIFSNAQLVSGGSQKVVLSQTKDSKGLFYLSIGWDDNFNYKINKSKENSSWYHICAVNVNNSLRKIYVNGDLVAITNTLYPYYSDKLYPYDGFVIPQGKSSNQYEPGNSRYYDGLIDDAVFYNRILGSDEIYSLYNNISIVSSTKLKNDILLKEKESYSYLSNFNENLIIPLSNFSKNKNELKIIAVEDIDGNRYDDILWSDKNNPGVLFFNSEINSLKESTINLHSGYSPSALGNFNKINLKDISLYSSDSVFLVSDKNWKDVLPMVPLTTWTKNKGDISKCQEGYQTANNTCVYPTLIWHDETSRLNGGFDLDSILNFLEDYGTKKIYLVGDTPLNIDNILVSKKPFGAEIKESNIIRILPEDYLNYWKNFEDVVYVEDNYTSALVASEYASLLNAPLIIQGNDNSLEDNFYNKNVICVGKNASSMYKNCDETYTYQELQEKYIQKTNTKKVIITAFDDLNSWEYRLKNFLGTTDKGFYYTDRSTGVCFDLFTKTSLISPFLASSKQEIIVPIAGGDKDKFGSPDVEKIDLEIESELNRLFKIKNLLEKDKDNYLEDFYITIVSSAEGIDYSLKSEFLYQYWGTHYYGAIAADQYFYSNFDSENGGMPNVNIGRIFGTTSSDFSTFVYRGLFYDRMQKTDKIYFMVTNPFDFLKLNSIPNVVKKWYDIFAEVHEDSLFEKGDYTIKYFYPVSNWENTSIISYNDHGASSWAGIYSDEIPRLDNTIFFNYACSTCSASFFLVQKSAGPTTNTFCSKAIKQGAVAYVGAVAVASGVTPMMKDTMNNIYYYNMSLGQAFNLAYKESAITGKEYYVDYLDNYKFILYGDERQMFTVIGDPTLYLGTKLNKQKLEEFW